MFSSCHKKYEPKKRYVFEKLQKSKIIKLPTTASQLPLDTDRQSIKLMAIFPVVSPT